MHPCVLIAFLALLPSCVSDRYVWVDNLPTSALQGPPYRVQPGDRLIVNVWNQAPLSGEVLVRPDGNITLPLVGDIDVRGRPPPEVATAIGHRLKDLVQDPHVAVSLAATKEPNVSVVGEVRQAGTYPLRIGEGVLEVLARAGGLSEFASKGRIFVVRRRETLRVRFDYDRLARADGAAVKFVVQDGDVVIVE